MSLSVDARKKLRNIVINDEGFRESMYKDSKGFWTIGFGFNLETQSLPMSVALEWLDLLLFNVESKLGQNISFWNELNDARKVVLIDMAYQMGIGGLLQFRGMLKALGSKDYAGAVSEMKDSVWYKDYTARASRLVKMMLSGDF